MPTGWDVYYLVFLSAVLALGIPASLTLISRLIKRKELPGAPTSDREYPQPAPTLHAKLGRRLNTRFFSGASAAVLLMAFGLLLIPCAGLLKQGHGSEEATRALIAILSLAGFASLALLYSVRKGDLNWLKDFQSGGDDR